jgi:hypothetical protein
MQYVDNFQVQYGYDAKSDGIQWADTVPPPNAPIDGTYDSWVPTPDGVTYDFSFLKVIKIIVTIKSQIKGTTQTTPYQTILYIRN